MLLKVGCMSSSRCTTKNEHNVILGDSLSQMLGHLFNFCPTLGPLLICYGSLCIFYGIPVQANVCVSWSICVNGAFNLILFQYFYQILICLILILFCYYFLV